VFIVLFQLTIFAIATKHNGNPRKVCARLASGASISDKPRSILQKYRLTEKVRAWFAEGRLWPTSSRCMRHPPQSRDRRLAGPR